MARQDVPKSPRLPWWRRWFGSRSERAAARYLRGLGYRILLSNWRTPRGELDLVALDGRCLVFVEVRSTEDEECEGPLLSVNATKQQQLTSLALEFLQLRRLFDQACRFDVLAISWPPGAKAPTIQHVPNAFEADGRFQIHS